MSLPPHPFPLSFPIPCPLTHPTLLEPSDIAREEDLLRNPNSFRHWWTVITATVAAYAAEQRAARTENEVPSSLGVFKREETRLQFQRLVYLYESALQNFPTSFKLWKSYLLMRRTYLLGSSHKRKKAGGRRKGGGMREWMEDELADGEVWNPEWAVDPVLGWEEWRSLVGCFERAVLWLPNVRPLPHTTFLFSVLIVRVQMPRIWLLYLTTFLHPSLPPPLSHTHARRTFDRALRTLPPSLHPRIWPLYLHFAESRGGLTMVHVYRRYLRVDESLSERFGRLLLGRVGPEDEDEDEDDEGGKGTKMLLPERRGDPRPLEAAKLFLSLARKAAKSEYTSPSGTSPYGLLLSFLEVVESFPDDVGYSPDDEEMVSVGEEETEMTNPKKLDVERIIKEDGLDVYKDQAGRLWGGLATYWSKKGDFDRVSGFLFLLLTNGADMILGIGQKDLRTRPRLRPHRPRLHPNLRRLRRVLRVPHLRTHGLPPHARRSGGRGGDGEGTR